MKAITKRQKLKNDLIGFNPQAIITNMGEAIAVAPDALYIHDVGVVSDINNKVSNWSDISVNANHAFQTTLANQPTFVSTVPTNVQFSDSIGTNLTFTPIPLLNKSLFFVFNYDNTTKQNLTNISGSETDGIQVYMDVNTLNIVFINGVTQTLDIAGSNLVSHAITGANFMVQINFGATAWNASISHSGNTTSFAAIPYDAALTATNLYRLGSDNILINNTSVGMYEVAIFPILDASQSTNALNYSKDRYGV